jgi:peroxiredoxin
MSAVQFLNNMVPMEYNEKYSARNTFIIDPRNIAKVFVKVSPAHSEEVLAALAALQKS